MSLPTSGMVEFPGDALPTPIMSEAMRLGIYRGDGRGPGERGRGVHAGLRELRPPAPLGGSPRRVADLLQRESARFVDQGRYLVRDEFLCYLAEVECRAGNWEAATRHAEEANQFDVESGRIWGRGHTLFPKALVPRRTRETGRQLAPMRRRGLRRREVNGDTFDGSCNAAVLGFLELSLSNPSAAIERLDPVLTFLDEMGAAEPASSRASPNAEFEALVALGDLDRADELLAVHEEKGRVMDFDPWALATAARCHGLLSAARLDSVRVHGGLRTGDGATRPGPDMPFELGRTLLALGEAQRRFKQRRAAGASIRAALETFRTLGVLLWATKAEEGLARIGARAAASPEEQTPTEQRVAGLVAERG